MRLKTKLFLGKDVNQFEKEVNEFLSNIDPNDLIDVKYEMTDTGKGTRHNITHSAMIIYKAAVIIYK